MSHSWRDIAIPIIAKVLAETAGHSEAAIKKALFAAYPFNERRYHPYKIWLDEIRRQRGTASTPGIRPAIAKLAEWEAIYGKRTDVQP